MTASDATLAAALRKLADRIDSFCDWCDDEGMVTVSSGGELTTGRCLDSIHVAADEVRALAAVSPQGEGPGLGSVGSVFDPNTRHDDAAEEAEYEDYRRAADRAAAPLPQAEGTGLDIVGLARAAVASLETLLSSTSTQDDSTPLYDLIDPEWGDELRDFIKTANEEIDLARARPCPSHVHVAGEPGDLDRCRQCGHDLRELCHVRVSAHRHGGWHSHEGEMAPSVEHHHGPCVAATSPAATAGLDAAWAEAEAALPEGWGLSVALEREDGQATARAGRIAFSWPPEVISTIGPTPKAALHALAARLRERGDDR